MPKYAELALWVMKYLLFPHVSLTDTFPRPTNQNTFIQICFLLKGFYNISQNSSSYWRYEWFQRHFEAGLSVAFFLSFRKSSGRRETIMAAWPLIKYVEILWIRWQTALDSACPLCLARALPNIFSCRTVTSCIPFTAIRIKNLRFKSTKTKN